MSGWPNEGIIFRTAPRAQQRGLNLFNTMNLFGVVKCIYGGCHSSMAFLTQINNRGWLETSNR